MSNFKMRNRPKKPSATQHVSMNVGNYVSLNSMLDTIKKFQTEYPDVEQEDICIEAEGDDYGAQIELTAPPEAHSIYLAKLEAYKVEFKAYKSWQKANEKEIDKYKAAKKKATAKTKLVRTQERLEKEIKIVNAKLEKV